MESLQSGAQKSSDPYEFYELRHPLDRASPVVQSNLTRQPGIAPKHTPFNRIVIEDSQDPVSLRESTAAAATYPRPYCMPSQESLLDPLSDDESTPTLASIASYDHLQRATLEDSQSLFDFEMMNIPVVTGDFLSGITWQCAERATETQRKQDEENWGNEQSGVFLRAGIRLGCAVLRRFHLSQVPNIPPPVTCFHEKGETTPTKTVLVPNIQDQSSTRKTEKRIGSSLRATHQKRNDLGKYQGSSGPRERLSVTCESSGRCLWLGGGIESTKECETSVRDIDESVSTQTSRDWLTSSHVSELSLSAARWKQIFKRKSPTHHVAKDVHPRRWSSN